MNYRVVVTSSAKENLRDAYRRAAENAPATAARWLSRFEAALDTLASHPERCTLAPENAFVVPEIRQMFFGKPTRVYRVLFTIEKDEVRVLHIRWGAMDFAEADDLIDEG